MVFMTDFDQLYQRYSKDIFRFSLFLCGNKNDAEDITAETFVRALTGNAPLKSNTVKGYLLTIAKNLFYEMHRKASRQIGLAEVPVEQGIELEHSLFQEQELKALFEFLQTIKQHQRAALLMRIDGLSYIEIAEALELSVSSAKVTIHRLRLKLAKWRLERESN
jgi:RNA polymerase sigma-70 factor, ECF subfamily